MFDHEKRITALEKRIVEYDTEIAGIIYDLEQLKIIWTRIETKIDAILKKLEGHD